MRPLAAPPVSTRRSARFAVARQLLLLVCVAAALLVPSAVFVSLGFGAQRGPSSVPKVEACLSRGSAAREAGRGAAPAPPVPPSGVDERRSWSSCRSVPFVPPRCHPAGGFDKSAVCHLRNVCLGAAGPGHGLGPRWLFFSGPAEGGDAGGAEAGGWVAAPPVVAPYLRQEGTPLELVEVGGAVPRSAARWRDRPVALFQASSSRGSRYYHLLVEDLGALFWLLAELGGPDAADVVLEGGPELDRVLGSMSPEGSLSAAELLPSLAGGAGAGDGRNAGVDGNGTLTCFRHVAVGCGCRSLWWHPDAFAFDPPRYVDFLGLDPAAYVHPAGRVGSEPTSLDWRDSPVRRLFRDWLYCGLGSRMPAAPRGPRVVFAARGEGRRRLLNEHDLLVALGGWLEAAGSGELVVARSSRARQGSQSRGVPGTAVPLPPTVVEMGYDWGEPGSFAAQVDVYRAASVVVGVHGAGLTNLVAVADPAAVVELFGNLHENSVFEVLCEVMGHRYASWRPSSGRIADRACLEPISSACKDRAFAVDVAEVVALVRAQVSGLGLL